jgi:soluble lytic murein transglycosylase-like protein
MQVLPHWHQKKVAAVGGEPQLLEIEPNIQVGTAILAEYLKATDGKVDAALARYRGLSEADTYVSHVREQMKHLTLVQRKAEARYPTMLIAR